MTADIIINKTETIKRCIGRILEEFQGDQANLLNVTKQDSIVLNLQRACEAAIDLAMHVVSEKRLGVPQASRDAFQFLYDCGMIDEEVCIRMKAMVGFRNIAIHNYQALQLEIVRSIIQNHLNDFLQFAQVVHREMNKSSGR